MRGLADVSVDPDAKTARLGAGVTWRMLDEATQAHGLAVTGAWISSVGVVGCALGRGAGWLERRSARPHHVGAPRCSAPARRETVAVGREQLLAAHDGVVTELELA